MNLVPEALSDALTRLKDDVGLLVRNELQTFKKEAIEQLRPVAMAGAIGAAGGVAALAFVGAFTVLLIAALSLAVPVWAAALIVTAIYGAATAGLLAVAAAKLKAALPIDFPRTARSVKEDVAWIKSDLKSGK